MATRTITAKLSAAGILLNNGVSVRGFAVESDTGPIGISGDRVSALVTITEIETYNSTSVLFLLFDSVDSSRVAEAGPLAQDDNPHEVTVLASEIKPALLTASPGTILVGLKDANFDSHTALGRCESGGTLQLDILCVGSCTPPDAPWLAATQSIGDPVALRWSEGAGGVDNAFTYYEVQRKLSTNGGTSWGEWEAVVQAPETYAEVRPPAAVGHMYKFRVRTVGSAGSNGASDWVECASTLKKIAAPLVVYTDPIITPEITKVKAAHITELQTNINLVRRAALLLAYEFTAIRAGYTDLNGWNAHIEELREAIDGVGVSHETWLALGANCPRADVLVQLRRVVEAVAND